MGIGLDGQTTKQVIAAIREPSNFDKLAICDLTGAKSLDNYGNQIGWTHN